MYDQKNIQEPLAKDRLSTITGKVHDFTWEKIVNSEKGHALVIVAQDAEIASIEDIIAEKFMIPHEILKETASQIAKEDWSYLKGQHYVAKLVALRALQISGLKHSEDIYDSTFWRDLACRKLLELYETDNNNVPALLEELLIKASNDVGDSADKKKILGRGDKESIQQRALKIIEVANVPFLNNGPSNYDCATPEEVSEKTTIIVAA